MIRLKRLEILFILFVFASVIVGAKENKKRKEKTEKVKVNTNVEQNKPPLRDPFSYGTNEYGDDLYIPAKEGDLPVGITVLGIIKIDKKTSLAVLSSSEGHIFFVKENNIIMIPSHSDKINKKKSLSNKGIHLEIKQILKSEVVIVLKRRPDKRYKIGVKQ